MPCVPSGPQGSNSAFLMLSEMARGLPHGGRDHHEIVGNVRDQTGKPILTATLSLVAR